MLYGSTNYFRQSRFISEIPENLLNIRQETGFRAMAGLDRAAKHSPYVASAREHHIDRGFSGSGKASPKVTTGDIDYKVGDTVIHKVFGEGVITKQHLWETICCSKLPSLNPARRKLWHVLQSFKRCKNILVAKKRLFVEKILTFSF